MEVLGKLQFALVMQAIGRKGWEDVRTVDEIASEFAKEVCEKRGIVDPQQQSKNRFVAMLHNALRFLLRHGKICTRVKRHHICAC